MHLRLNNRFFMKGALEVLKASHGVHVDIYVRDMHYEIRTEGETQRSCRNWCFHLPKKTRNRLRLECLLRVFFG